MTTKVANEKDVAIAARPTLQELVKSASEGAFAKANFAEEARRHLGDLGTPKTASVKTASAEQGVSTDFVTKLASACEFIADQIAKEASEGSKTGPGKGPNTLPLTEAKDGPSISEDSGKAKNQPPAPATNGTQMANDMKSPPGGPGEQKVAKVEESEDHAKEEMKKLDKIEDKVEEVAEKKAAELRDLLQKAAKATPPEGVSDASQPGGSVVPHVGSNDAAASITPRDAQAQPKKDMKAYIDEPMQTSSTDKVLNNAFANTSKAQPKIAEDQKVAAAKELLARLGKGA